MIVKQGIKIGGMFDVKCYDKDGNLRWREFISNMVVDVGIENMLDVYFHGAGQTSPLYIGLKDTGAVVAGDTLASHGGWSEQSNYSGTRKEYEEAAATGKSTTNSANLASFTINNDATIAGAFIATVTSGTVGTLFCASDFGTSRNAASGDSVTVSYTITGSDS